MFCLPSGSKTAWLTTLGQFRNVLTGSYNNYFHIYDKNAETDVVLQADKSAFKAKKVGGNKGGNKGKTANGLRKNMETEPMDFQKKILHASWHPQENIVAVRDIPFRIVKSCSIASDFLRAAGFPNRLLPRTTSSSTVVRRRTINSRSKVARLDLPAHECASQPYNLFSPSKSHIQPSSPNNTNTTHASVSLWKERNHKSGHNEANRQGKKKEPKLYSTLCVRPDAGREERQRHPPSLSPQLLPCFFVSQSCLVSLPTHTSISCLL